MTMLWLKQEAVPTLSRVVSIVVIAAEGQLDPKPAGRFYVARCWRANCGGQLVLDPATNTYRCNGPCGERGNVVGLTMRLHNLRLVGALRFLAERAGRDFASFLTEQCDCTACARRRCEERTSEVPSWALTLLPTLTLVSRGGR
jgi:hypothetical protein